MIIKRVPWLVLALALVMLSPVAAQEVTRIAVDPNDSPLTIRGWVGEENAFVGNLRLTAVGGNVESFTFLASDLEMAGGDEVIGRQQITLSGSTALAENVPQNFQVLVNGITLPGIYEGTITLLLPGQTEEGAVTVPVTVTARARPVLTALPGTSNLSLRLVNCAPGPDCWLARLFLPQSAFLDLWSLQFDNETEAPVKVEGVEAVVLGEGTGYQLTEKALAPPEAVTLPADGIISLPLLLNRSAMPPDHYTGRLYLILEGQAGRLSIPVDLSVRVGPFWPLVALLLGIVLGRLFKYMQERGEPQAEALDKVNALEVRVQEMHAEDQKILLPMVERLRQAVYQEKLEMMEVQIQALDERREALLKLRNIERAIEGNQHPNVARIQEKIAQTRLLIGQRQDAHAQEVLQEIQTLLAGLGTGIMNASRGPDTDIINATTEAAAAVTAVGQAATAPPLRALRDISAAQERLRRFLVGLSGLSDRIRAEATLWLVRPLLYLALLLGLVAVGMSSLYLKSGATFGADPFADYLGLVLWGLSADVASRSLSNLQGGG
ncbi:MAG: hypothetical protein ACLFU8_03825 [Anaerolineales bacterium]